MMLKTIQHLKSNKGDVYIYFLIFLICLTLLFSSVFGLMQLRISMKNIYNEIEASADAVIAEIKKENYQILIDGTTENTEIPVMSSKNITNRLATELGAEQSANQIEKKTDSETIFIIRDIEVFYNDSYEEESEEGTKGLLQIKFNIEIPVKFNGNIIYTATKTYIKNTTLNFK